VSITPAVLTTSPSPIAGTNYQLVWSDEFNGTSVDTSKWNEVGPWGEPVASHGANFRYDPSNVSVSNGVATITAQRSGNSWTGGILSTDSTKEFQYGFVEVRAQLPKGQGFWPAIWLYGGSSADELDVVESSGGDASTVYQVYHFPGGQHQDRPSSPDWTTGYHLFQMKWEPGRLTYYIDNVQTGSWTESVPARPMYLMLNFDVGGPGDWSGAADGATPSSATFNVDYVRVYQ
jgi:beta-glucanase (GH16 family)